MVKNEFCLLNHLYEVQNKRNGILNDIYTQTIIQDVSLYNRLQEEGMIDDNYHLTAAGLKALAPYKVNNAVIMAAGSSTRFIPLSLEKPKGLFEVKGERLIDRQIEQLQEAGIKDITVILGYKKEMFFYLKERYNVKFIFNTSYNIKNNIESLYLARGIIGNTYICSCDDYFTANPFHQYEYESFYAGMKVDRQTSEMYCLTRNGLIIKMEKGAKCGQMLLGHSYWQNDFALKFFELAAADRELGIYNTEFWEKMVKDNLSVLPAFYFKEYPEATIHEFDYFEELRQFDQKYSNNSNSEIINNIKKVFNCQEKDIVNFRTISEGMTNTSFIFRIKDTDYIYRHPGDGTESIINRKNEKQSLQIAKELKIDPTFIYMDIEKGWKISKYVREFREPDYHNFEDTKKIVNVLKKLHASNIKVNYGLDPWNDALTMENMLIKKDPDCLKSFYSLKNKIRVLVDKTVNDGIDKCFCHGDTYRPNWMILPNDEVLLIDWEYSGFCDPGIDVGYYIVDAMYDFDEAKKMIKEYLKESYSKTSEFHFMAYTAIIAYYWFIWAMFRESCGAIMGESLYNWYEMAKKYADYALKAY